MNGNRESSPWRIPVLWLVMSSFKTESAISQFPPTFLPYSQKSVAVSRARSRRAPRQVGVPVMACPQPLSVNASVTTSVTRCRHPLMT